MSVPEKKARAVDDSRVALGEFPRLVQLAVRPAMRDDGPCSQPSSCRANDIDRAGSGNIRSGSLHSALSLA